MGQSVSRLFALLGAYFPGMLQRQQQAGEAGTDRGYSSDEMSSTAGTGKLYGSTGGPSAFFGNHFLMGGEMYDTKPEVYLFGEQQDLDLLGSKPVKFPHSPKRVTDSVSALNALVNVRKDSVKFSKVGRTGVGYSSGFYRLEFTFDCDVSCYVQIHFCAKESIDEHQQTRIVCRQTHFDSSERYHFPVGANQQFSHFVFKPHRYDLKLMHWDGGSPYFPVLIEIRSVSDQFPEQVQSTMCSIERSADQSTALILKPLKQKLIFNGVVFLLQEIFGIENKENAETSLTEENGAECIICMANPRDTMILPCRHLCICNGCAETLRYKLNNCPICRSPFKALLKIRALRSSLVGVGSDATGSMLRIRREPLTLFEAINGLSTSTVQRPTTQAPNKSFAIARCDAHGDVVTTATASTSDPLGGNSPLKAINQKAVVVKKRITKSDLDTEHIELDEIDTRAREIPHASFIHYSPGSSSITRRSSNSPPPLGRAHSPFSTANSSYQSARSIPEEERDRGVILASAPNLVTESDERSMTNLSIEGENAQQSSTLGKDRRKRRTQKGSKKRMSEPLASSSLT